MIPDYALETTFDFKFPTRTSAGAPITFAGSPAVEVYEDNSTTQITAGITLTVDFDGVTGLHNLRIAATDSNGFEAGKSYAAVVSAGTVDGNPVAGEPLLNFSIERLTDHVASKDQVDGIGSGSGGSIPFQAIEDNTGGAIDPSSAAFVGSVTGSTTFANTASEDGIAHTMNDTSNDIDIVYGFQVGGGRVGTTIQIAANVNGNSDEIKVKAYDHIGAAWDIVGTVAGSGGVANKVIEPSIFQKHTGTGAEIGKVYIRFETDSTTPASLSVDQCAVLATNIGQSIGYSGGAVWLDTNASNTNTESFVDGVADNPVSTIGAALTIAAAVGIKRIQVISGSSFTLAATQANCEYIGHNYAMALGGQSITDCFISGATLSGTATGSGTIYMDCIIDDAITIPPSTMRSCKLGDTTITAGSAGSFYFNSCQSRVAGTGSVNFDFGSGLNASGLSMRDYSGGVEIENMGAGTGTYTMSLEGNGALTINANCSATSQVALRGNFKITDNASGAVTVIPTVPTIGQVDQGAAQAGTANSITLASTASSDNGAYDPGIVTIVAGTAAGESRLILGYNGTTKVAEVGRDWRNTPDATSSYIVTTNTAASSVNEGFAQAGTSTTITLNTAASATDDIYNGQSVWIMGGTGQDQARIVTAYNGTTKVATIHKPWVTNPASDTSYMMLPLPTIGDAIANIETGIADVPTVAEFETKTDLVVSRLAKSISAIEKSRGNYVYLSNADRGQGGVDTGVLVPESGSCFFSFINHTSTSNEAVFGASDDSITRFTVFKHTTGTLRVSFRGTGALIETAVLEDGRVYNCFMNWDGDDISLSINGAIYTATATGDLPSVRALRLGSRNNTGTTDLVYDGVIKSLQMRDSDGLLILDSNDFAAIQSSANEAIDFFIVGGQSNAVGRGPTASSQTPPAGTAFDFDWGTFASSNLADPVGYTPNVATNGSFVPAFAKQYNALTGSKVLIVQTATGAAEQTSGATQAASNSWDTDGDLYGLSVGKAWKAINFYRQLGYTVNLRGIVWCQGETDAGVGGINGAYITKAEYKTAFTTMIENFRVEFGDLQFHVSRTGTKTSDSDAGFEEIRDAQDEIAAANEFVHMGFTGAVDFDGEGKLSDVVHYTTLGYDEVGVALAESAADETLRTKLANLDAPISTRLATGADGDTGKTLSDQLDSGSGGGSLPNNSVLHVELSTNILSTDLTES